MSLLDEAMESCVLLDATTAPDGYGAYITTWQDGAEIQAAFRFDSSMQAKIAEKQGVTSLYTIITRKNINLPYHQVLRRISDGKLFRVTSDGYDNKTPNSAGLNMREVSAEEWSLPNG